MNRPGLGQEKSLQQATGQAHANLLLYKPGLFPPLHARMFKISYMKHELKFLKHDMKNAHKFLKLVHA